MVVSLFIPPQYNAGPPPQQQYMGPPAGAPATAAMGQPIVHQGVPTPATMSQAVPSQPGLAQPNQSIYSSR